MADSYTNKMAAGCLTIVICLFLALAFLCGIVVSKGCDHIQQEIKADE